MTSPDWDAAPPYTGPPRYAPPPYGGAPLPYGPPPYGHGPAPYGYGQQPGWGWAPYPVRPRRPGTVIAAAVLAFVSALMVLVGTLYAAAFGALLSLTRGPGHGIGAWPALLQVLLAGLLVAGGLRVLARDRRWLLAGGAGQLVASGCWLGALADLTPATLTGSVLVLPVLYAVPAVVELGLLFLPDARTWTARPAAQAGSGG